MKVEIITAGDGWVLDEMAEQIKQKIPGASISTLGASQNNLVDLVYFMHYGLYKGRISQAIHGCFFPHKEPPDPSYDFVACSVDFCVGMSLSSYKSCSMLNENSHLIYPGINLNLFKPKLRVGFVGREYPSGRKGGAIFDELRKLDWIEFKATNGKLPKDKIPDFIGELDLVLIASEYEGGPLCFLEALASGVKVVSTDVGLPAEFKHFEGVYIYPFGDFRALKEVLETVYQEKVNLRRSVEGFSSSNFGENYLELFQHYINNQPNKPKVFPVEKKCSINLYATRVGLGAINLHLGCGGEYMKGWINIDNYDYDPQDSSRTGSNYDIKMDIRNIEVEDSSVDRILLVHVLEHFVRWEAIEMLKHYFNKLKRGGLLLVEQPDLDMCIDWYLKGGEAPVMPTPLGPRNMGFTQFYGNQWDGIEYETHRYVWTKKEFAEVLSEIGFEIVALGNEAKFHQPERDMWVEARKT